MRFLSTILRPAFGLFLFLAQFTATRGTLFTTNVTLLGLSVILILVGLWLWGSASRHFTTRQRAGRHCPDRTLPKNQTPYLW